MWKWVEPAAREAAYALWMYAGQPPRGRDPGLFHFFLMMAMDTADEPTLAQMAGTWPGLASAVVAGKAGDFFALWTAAGEFAAYVDERPGAGRPGIRVDHAGCVVGRDAGDDAAVSVGDAGTGLTP